DDSTDLSDAPSGVNLRSGRSKGEQTAELPRIDSFRKTYPPGTEFQVNGPTSRSVRLGPTAHRSRSGTVYLEFSSRWVRFSEAVDARKLCGLFAFRAPGPEIDPRRGI